MRQPSLTADIDSWVWSLRATLLDRGSFDWVSPSGGAAAMLKVTINGYVREFLVDDPDRSDAWDAWDADSYTVTASSVTVVLAAPYARWQDLTSTSAMTAQ